jgi:hypothetical protein
VFRRLMMKLLRELSGPGWFDLLECLPAVSWRCFAYLDVSLFRSRMSRYVCTVVYRLANLALVPLSIVPYNTICIRDKTNKK